MAKTEDKYYVVPELEVRVHESWINLVRYCQTQIPYGDIKIRIVDGRPTELLEERQKVRFDRNPPVSVAPTEAF